MGKIFKERIKKYEVLSGNRKKKYNLIGNLKLLLIILILPGLFFTFRDEKYLTFGVPVLAAIVLFIILSVVNSRTKRQLKYYQGIIDINTQYIDRINGEWIKFCDTGEEFIDYDHPYSSDLDIVGKKSLFQYINITNTWHGRQRFAADLLNPEYSKEEIRERQKAAEELSGNVCFCQDMQYYFSEIGSGDKILKLIEDLKEDKRLFKSKALGKILETAPFCVLAFIATVFIAGLEVLYSTAGILILLQCAAWLGGSLKTIKYLGAIGEIPYRLSTYSFIINKIKHEKYSSKILNDIKEQLNGKDISAEQAIKRLGKISGLVNARHNGVINVLFNVLFLWDIRCALMLERWRRDYGRNFEKWFWLLGDFESIMSLSVLPNVCNNTCIPLISDEGKEIKAKSMGHPLLTDSSRVNNDIDFDDQIFIISGSNMSGKTTFLRTVGINTVLAAAGGFVCAENMKVSLFKIITSMRITDDLNDGISTFYAELKRIKKIIEVAGTQKNVMFFIDEIFKGTNSVDRMTGARTVISKLNDFKTSGMVTTHDLELCNLALKNAGIENYNFSEYYKNNEIMFDYKIKVGKSLTTNAEYLMKMIGIM